MKTSEVGIVVSGLLALVSCANEPALSDTYISKGASYGVMLQVNSQQESAVEGMITAVEIAESGKLEAGTKPITGIRNGKALTLTVQHPAGSAPPTTTVTGTINGADLNLTFFSNGGAHTLLFKPAKAEDFTPVIQSVRTAAGEFQAAAHYD
jgi:hypothetical protein